MEEVMQEWSPASDETDLKQNQIQDRVPGPLRSFLGKLNTK
jgi:hypothetical protein